MLDYRLAAEAADILRQRREKDGLHQLVTGEPGPFKHQAAFWASEKSEAWLFGANRSGKTEALMAQRASRLRFGNPNPKGAYGGGIAIFDRAIKAVVVSLKFDMSRNIVQAKLFNNGAGVNTGREPMIPDSEIQSWNITNQTLRLKNGSLCLFKSCDQGARAFQGFDADDIDVDEVWDEEVAAEACLRVGGGRRLRIRGAATILPPLGEPGGISWMYQKKVRPWLDGGKNDPQLDIFTASIYDNPTILPEEIARMEAQFPPGSPEYMIRLKGVLLPSIGGSLVYPAFQRNFHMVPVPRDREGVPCPEIDPYAPLVLAVDFNPTNGCWLIGQKGPRGIFRVLDEINLERSDIPTMTNEFRLRYPRHGGELWIYGDATGRRREGQTGEASFYLIQEHLQNYPAPVRFIIPEVNPPVKDRVAAVSRVLRPGDGSRMVQIYDHCERLAYDLETAKWKANGTVDKSKEQLNGADSFGYWIVGDSPVPRYRTGGGLRAIRSPGFFSRGVTGRPFPAGVTRVAR